MPNVRQPPTVLPTVAPDGRTLLEFEREIRVREFVMSPDGRTLVTSRIEVNPTPEVPHTEVALWDMVTGKKTQVVDWGVRDGVFSPDGRLFANLKRAVTIWNTTTGAVHRRFQPTGIPYFGKVDFSADGKWILYPGITAFAHINVESGMTYFTQFDKQSGVSAAKYFPHQPRLAVGRFQSGAGAAWIEIYDLNAKDGPELALKVNTRVVPEDLAISRDGGTLVAADRDNMSVFETKNWTVRAQLVRKSPRKLESRLSKVVVSPDGAFVAVIPSYSGRPKLELWTVDKQAMQEFGPEWCQDVAFLADGTLAIASMGNSLQFFDPRSGRQLPPPRPAQVAAVTPAKPDEDLAGLPPLKRAQAYRVRGRFAEAISVYAPLLAAAEKEHGASDPQTLELARALADCQRGAGDFAKAVELYRRCFTASEAALVTSTAVAPDDALNLAHTLILSGNRREAIESLQKNLVQRTARLGAEHACVAAAEHALGWVYAELGDDLASNEHYAQSLKIRRRVLPNPHADLADSLMMSGHLQARLDQFDRALPLLEQALKMYQALPGGPHPRLAEAQVRLAGAYERMREWEKAAEWFQRSEETFGSAPAETPSAVYVLRELAARWARLVWPNAAEANCRRALEFANRVYGPKHVVIPQIHADMAENYLHGQMYVSCIDSQTEAIAALRAFYGDDYPHRAEHLRRLAEAKIRANQLDDAEKLLQEIRQIETAPTAEGRDTAAATALDYGQLHLLLQRPDESLSEFDRGVRGIQAKTVEVLPLLPDMHKVRFAESQAAIMHIPYSAVLHFRGQPKWLERGAEWAINLKGLSDEILAQQMLLQRDAPDESVRRLAQELSDTRNQIAALSIGGVDADAVGDRAEQARRLMQREKELTTELGRSVPRVAAVGLWKSLDQVRASLDPKTVLVETVLTRLYNIQRNRWGEISYLAFVVPPQGKGNVQLVELGEVGQVWMAVKQYRDTLQETALDILDDESRAEAVRRMDKATADLSAQLVHKLQPAIGPYDRWLLGLDGALWLVPWAALQGTDGKLLVENKEIGYVTSGRLLGSAPPKHKASAAVVVADPDFDHGVPSGTGGGAFAALMASAAEAEMVAPKIGKYAGAAPQVFTRERASEATLKAQKNPRVLFLSTHGYYEEHAWGKHPLLRCGLALAGANGSVLAGGTGTTAPATALTVPVLGAVPAAAVDDGILTGLEAVSLDLRGAELVVLSACHTGSGELRMGQGVTGLRQSFHLAGADSVLAALWAINDGDTADLMGRFFNELSNGQRKTAALRRAQLTTIENLRARRLPPHPHLWAAFILTGEGD
jgi:CHAT domain-containing protein